MISDGDRQRIRGALLDRSPVQLERIFVALVLAGELAVEVEKVAREELGRLPHAVHSWWQAPCPCAAQTPAGEPETAPT